MVQRLGNHFAVDLYFIFLPHYSEISCSEQNQSTSDKLKGANSENKALNKKINSLEKEINSLKDNLEVRFPFVKWFSGSQQNKIVSNE